jgi:hypothetical protein
MCGVNDQTFSVPLGAMGDNGSDTTYGALNLLCSLLKQKYPTKLVVFITPHYQTNYKHSGGITSYEVSKAIREVCEKYAIPVYDNFVLSGIYSTNLSTFTTDNCHWNDTTHEMVGKNLARFMVNTFRYIHGNTGGGNVPDVPVVPDEPEVTLTSIFATFNQGDAVIYDTDNLDSLKQYLTVTANYSDGSAETVTDYVLSGTLTEGTSTITVSYSGKTATFGVTVTKYEVKVTRMKATDYTIENGFITTTGTIQDQSAYGHTDKIPVNEFQKIEIYSDLQIPLAFYDSEENFIKMVYEGASNPGWRTVTETMPDGCGYIAFNVKQASADSYYVDIYA